MRRTEGSKTRGSAGPNFVSGQSATCLLHTAQDGRCRWGYVRHGDRVVTAGMPEGPTRERALATFLNWCSEHDVEPVVFGCEESDLDTLEGWDITEIGRQPLFRAGPDFDPTLSGQSQPHAHRKLRRQARRALSKGVVVKELGVAELWRLSETGVLDPMLYHRWQRRGLADFSFLVEFRLEGAQSGRRAFLAHEGQEQKPLALVFMVPSRRGWLLEHQMLSPEAPNGTAEFILCRLLSQFLQEDELLSLGLTPLYRELRSEKSDPHDVPGVLDPVPGRLVGSLLKSWEPLYGFRRLLHFRQKLEPHQWETVYWAVPRRRWTKDLLTVLRAFAGGSFWSFGLSTVHKWLHKFALSLKESFLLKINMFYVVTLFLWIPILWNIDSIPLFGNAEACKVWAIYDMLLLFLFAVHHRTVKNGVPSFVTDLLLGLVTADTVLAWIQTAMYHGGLPKTQPLGAFVFAINTAPVSALLFLILVKLACKPVPFRRRELLQT